MILEVCSDSLETTFLAQEFGAKRVELCSALSVGGLTPSLGLIAACLEHSSIEIHCMIRHREGDFVYSDLDLEILKKDIQSVSDMGVKGVVFGCLNSHGEINTRQTEELVRLAKGKGLEVTFHRAFDFVYDYESALEQLIFAKVDRILTSGGEAKAIQGKERIQKMVQLAQGRIQIMAGSGVHAENALELAETGIDALHFTSHVSEGKTELGMGAKTRADREKIGKILKVLMQNSKFKMQN
ncbi:MAG: copper homeostasis protein CutC [Crocinitomicaceae bacterium]